MSLPPKFLNCISSPKNVTVRKLEIVILLHKSQNLINIEKL